MSKIIACLWFTLIAFHSLLIASSYSLLLLLEPLTGFEPVTSSLPRRCSNQLSYKGGFFFKTPICGVRTLNLRFNVPTSTPHLKFNVLPCTWTFLRKNRGYCATLAT